MEKTRVDIEYSNLLIARPPPYRNMRLYSNSYVNAGMITQILLQEPRLRFYWLLCEAEMWPYT